MLPFTLSCTINHLTNLTYERRVKIAKIPVSHYLEQVTKIWGQPLIAKSLFR